MLNLSSILHYQWKKKNEKVKSEKKEKEREKRRNLLFIYRLIIFYILYYHSVSVNKIREVVHVKKARGGGSRLRCMQSFPINLAPNTAARLTSAFSVT